LNDFNAFNDFNVLNEETHKIMTVPLLYMNDKRLAELNLKS